MHGSLVLLCALCSVGANRGAQVHGGVHAEELPAHAPAEMSYVVGNDEYGCDDCDHGYWTGSCFCRCHSTCNMPPRIQYFPEAHGYYYFRPYNHSHIWRQQAIAASWGVDPRNPYSNEIFEGVYERFEQRLPPEEVLPPLPSAEGTDEAPVEPIPPQAPRSDLPEVEGDAPGIDDPQAARQPARITPVGRTTARLIAE